MNDAQLLKSMGTDASKWAREFCKLHPGTDEGTMLGWFANAIESRGAEIERLRKLTEWQPFDWRIEEGNFLFLEGDFIFKGHFDGVTVFAYGEPYGGGVGWDPTHYIPLPQPPSEDTKGEG